MDYEVFLISRIQEEWLLKQDNRVAVSLGQAATGWDITAAAAIMILVFGSFVFGNSIIIKQFGIGLAGAIIVDAFIIRTALVPALMHLFGDANWWLPGWLDRAIPHRRIAATQIATRTVAQHAVGDPGPSNPAKTSLPRDALG
jgi:RND superfamily putative drug exporter